MRELLALRRFALLTSVALVGTACAITAPDDTPSARPVEAPVRVEAPVPIEAPIEPRPTDAPHTSAPGGTTPSWHDVVDAVLERYGDVLTEMVADPARLLRPDDDLAVRWREVVVDGALSDDVTGRAFERLERDRMIVVPGPDGRAYHHVVVDVGPVGDDPRPDHLSFTWCGYSPGIGVHVDTGDVLDDDVAHARGTGSVRLVDDVWRLETLDQFELDLLGPGAADPCRPR